MKAKKVTFYFVDHDEVDNDEIISTMDCTRFPNRCISPQNTTVDEVDIGEWDDDHRCNFCDYDLSKEFET
jgi:hypothetical protein